jgi:galactose mutarotase-like enzyme
MDFPTSREHVLRRGSTTIGVISDICLVSHFQVGAWQVLYRPSETGNVKRWGLPLMIPNFSRLKDGLFLEKGTSLPIHGFGRNLPWTITRESENALAMQLQSSDVTRAMYPYDFTFMAKIEAGEAALTYTITMQNHSEEVMPIAPGFHPYFAVAQADKAGLVTDGPPGFAVQDFDWVERIPDNPYPFPHAISIQFPQQGTLHIEEMPVDGHYSLRNMQVWSEPPARPDHDFVCFEPTVGSEDALNRPADRLNIEAGGSHVIVLRLRVEGVQITSP